MSMPTCPTAQELIDLCIGKLPDDDVAAVSEHVERCGACRASVQALERIPIPFVDYYLRVPSSGEAGYSTEPTLQRILANVKQLGRGANADSAGSASGGS